MKTIDELFEELVDTITKEEFDQVYEILKSIKEKLNEIIDEKTEEKENEKIIELEKRIEKLEKMRLSSLQISKEAWINSIWE